MPTELSSVEFSTYLWSRMYAGLQLVTMREKGESGVADLKFNFMRSHGAKHFIAGLKKLGIDKDPPAIAAAKYHYLSNCAVGAVDMEYAEEGPKKAWIRYLAPAWAYPGSGLLAIPASTQIGAFRAWHQNNGTWLGCPRLGYVCTKLYQHGAPYDEGYFIEYDHDITYDEALKFETVDRSPGFDPAIAPRLDEAEWPLERLAKARRRYAEGYTAGPVGVLVRSYGVPYAAYLVAQAARGIGTQYAREIASRFGCAEKDAPAMARLLSDILSDLGIEHQSRSKDGSFFIERRQFAPLQDGFPDEIHDAIGELFPAIIAVLSDKVDFRVAVNGAASSESRTEVWKIEGSATRLR
ncbi:MULTISPECIES: hypothetical protein [unclassified Bradyrhizobium]|uniref:hypothetical protein n=1 Tax=unclassified Bradyrhizobium TaxID=2631580 RepID=UPI0020B2E781|nr:MULTISPECIES: hypothetical protein [unclassified Bradyrhizobium]MCP3379890.1 hypothetical protein [Bradyrhizobium sp. CCGUVB4N]MCP3440723.1 hypothetical protein [Bradyrhizobium sp. CCGUVB14]MCP3473491.1 hypothetical protein [Bradyrhizobium sp. CCGUVB1N3]